MNKRTIAVLVVVAVLLFAAILVYFDTELINRTKQTAQEPQGEQPASIEASNTAGQTAAAATGNNMQDSATTSPQTTIADMETEALVKTESVAVTGNTPEYRLELKLCESIDSKTFLRLQYYLNGTGQIFELDEGELPELAGIFESREKEQGNAASFRIGQALLNPVHSQLYLLIQGTPLEAYTQASLYMVKLNDMSVKKLFSYPGLYGKLTFNNDYSLLAYSFGDPPHLSNLQEDNLVEVFDCASGEYVIKANRNQSGDVLGKNSSTDYLYDYEFEEWQSVNVLMLRQAKRPKKDLNSGLTQIKVLYDIEKDMLFNLDGSELKPTSAYSGTEMPSAMDTAKDDGSNPAVSDGSDPGSSDGYGPAGTDKSDPEGIKVMQGTESVIKAQTGTKGDTTDSEPVKVLKSFYAYLAAESDYPKAMLLLDDSFRLRLDMLKQFGADEIIKSDINAGSASEYNELLKKAKLDTITRVESKAGICTIAYDQILVISTDSQIKQSMSAQLKMFGKVWKIILIEDGV